MYPAGPGDRRTAALLAATAMAGLAVACGDSTGPDPDPDTTPAIQTVTITSSIDTLVAVGRIAALTATARDASGAVVSATFTWTSSNTSVVAVGSTGQAYGQSAGTATVTATASGVSGRLGMGVLAADLSAIQTALTDPYAAALIAELEGNRTAVQAAWLRCVDASGTGHLVQLSTDLSAIRTLATDATGHDRAVLGALMLFGNHITRLLGL